MDTKTVFVPGCKHVYFCCKVRHFNQESCGNWLAVGGGAGLEWPLEELHFWHAGFIKDL